MIDEIEEICNRIDNAINNFDSYMSNKNDYVKGMNYFKTMLLDSDIIEINQDSISQMQYQIFIQMDKLYQANGFRTHRIMQGIEHALVIMYTYNNFKNYKRK